VRTASYQGKFVLTQRTAVSTYVDSLIIDSSSNATFGGTLKGSAGYVQIGAQDFVIETTKKIIFRWWW